MAGGLLQPAATVNKIYILLVIPQITFFKVVYRKITPFTIESIKQSYIGTVNPGNKVTVDIERQGDLLSRVWLNIIHKKIEPLHKRVLIIQHLTILRNLLKMIWVTIITMILLFQIQVLLI